MGRSLGFYDGSLVVFRGFSGGSVIVLYIFFVVCRGFCYFSLVFCCWQISGDLEITFQLVLGFLSKSNRS